MKFFLIDPCEILMLIYGNVIHYRFHPDLVCDEKSMEDINRLTLFTIVILALAYV